MSIDERLEFLLKSTESLHASSQEIHASIQGLRESVEGLRSTTGALHATTESLHATTGGLLAIAQEHTRQFAVQAESIRQLALIASAHSDRISLLERKTGT